LEVFTRLRRLTSDNSFSELYAFVPTYVTPPKKGEPQAVLAELNVLKSILEKAKDGYSQKERIYLSGENVRLKVLPLRP